MEAPLKVLFLPNWEVRRTGRDDESLQAPDKFVEGSPYWFFRHFRHPVEVEVIDLQPSSPFHRAESKAGIYPLQALKAWRRRRDFDVVLSHGAQSGLPFSMLNGRLPGRPAPHVMIDVGGLNGARTRPVETSLVGFALADDPVLVTHSSGLLEHYAARFPDLAPRARFVRFGVDLDDFRPSGPGTEPVVLAFGTIKRDYPTLLGAWRDMPDPWRLRIVGSRLESAPEGVELVPQVPVDRLKEEIARSRVVVVPLPWFNYSYGQMTFLQSMAAGRPVVVSRVPSSVDYLEGSRTARLVPHADSAALRSALLELLSLPAGELDALGAGARAEAERSHGEETMARRLEEILREAAGRA